jgi:hypothetical protein
LPALEHAVQPAEEAGEEGQDQGLDGRDGAEILGAIAGMQTQLRRQGGEGGWQSGRRRHGGRGREGLHVLRVCG